MEKQEYICEYCNRNFKTRQHYTIHLKKKHIDRAIIESHKCKNPGCKNLISFYKFKNHEEQKNKNKNYCCRECYNEHIKTSRKRNLQCENCNKKFTSITEYKKHINLNCEDNKFSCKYCNSNYNRKGDLNRHLFSSHSELIKIKKISCSNKNCSNFIKFEAIDDYIKGFYDNSYCSKECGKQGNKNKAKSRKSDTRYQCPFCRNNYVDEKLYDEHLNTTHLNNPYKCEFCKATYNSEITLHQHYNRYHTNEEVLISKKCEYKKCNNEFEVRMIGSYLKDKKRFCSKNCSRSYISSKGAENREYSYERLEKLLNSQGSCKWYDYFDKNGKKHRVQGMYEYAFAIKLDEMNIEFIAHPKGIKYINNENKQTYYFPDFYIPSKDLYVDTKAQFYLDMSGNKFLLIRDQNPNMNLLILTEPYLEAFGIDIKHIHKYKKEEK